MHDARVMEQFLYMLLVLVAGALVACQSPINSSLGALTGPINATLISFLIGTVAILVIAFATGISGISEVRRASPWQLVGGFMGAFFVASMIYAVPKIGLTRAMVATIAGQLLVALAIDHYGFFGVQVREVDWKRAMAIPLLAIAAYLVRA